MILMTGHLWCSCGRRLSGNVSHDVRYYRCNDKGDSTMPKEDRCIMKLINAVEVEAWAWERITAYLEEPERVARKLAKEAERLEDTQKHQVEGQFPTDSHFDLVIAELSRALTAR